MQVFRDPLWVERQIPVVVLHGGWTSDWIPVASSFDRLAEGMGFVEVHLDLPGATNPPSWPVTDGEDDLHGQGARKAVARVLRYAADLIDDEDGCRLSDRADGLAPEQLVLVGSSNGGNLAMAVLADTDVELPPVGGLVAWETPAGAQFVLKELDEQDGEACGWDETWGGLACEATYTNLRHDEVTWEDRDDDGVVDEQERVYDHLRVDGRLLHSPQLAAALGRADGAFGPEEAWDWFRWRDASRAAAGALARIPELGTILIGHETDHAQELAGSPHVVGLGTTLAEAGGWVRLNPDASYLEGSPDTPAFEGLDVDAPGELLADDIGRRAAVSAAALELADRVWMGDWSPDLEERL